jgi:exodeoxyribonuclease VIII
MNANDTHYVVDVETLGTSDNAIIASVGIVRIKAGVQDGHFYTVINTIQEGRLADDETLYWWSSDDRDAARHELLGDEHPELFHALVDVAVFLKTDNEKETAPIWGNGSDFDNRILGHAFRQHGLQWPYWRNACLRTLRNIVGGERYQPTSERIKHIAINDAMTEAEELAYLLSRITVKEQAVSGNSRRSHNLCGGCWKSVKEAPQAGDQHRHLSPN